MKSQLNSKTSELEILIAAKKEDWQKIQKNVQLKLIKDLSIKGFRKGKVPFDIGKRYISQSQIMKESVEKMIDKLSKEAMESIDSKTIVLAGPLYSISKISDADLEIKFTYPVFPEFKIYDYKNLKTKFICQKVTEKFINEEMEKFRSTQTLLKDKDNNIDKGDVVIFDFEGFINGETFKGSKAEKYELEIGSGKFIPGFEEQMIGMSKNEKKNIKVIFPKDYYENDLKGKEATFKVLVHEIKFKEVPKLDDNFVKTAGIPNVKTFNDLKNYIQKRLTNQYEQDARIDFQKKAFNEILKNTEGLVIPEIILKKETEALKNNMIENLKKRDIKFEKHLEMTGNTEEKLYSQFRNDAYSRLKDAFIFAEIAKLEKIIISENDYVEYYKTIANIYSQSVDDIKEIFSKEQIQVMLMNTKVLDILIKYAK